MSKAEGKPWEYEKVLRTPAEVYYFTQAVLNEQEDYIKDLQNIKNPRNE